MLERYPALAAALALAAGLQAGSWLPDPAGPLAALVALLLLLGLVGKRPAAGQEGPAAGRTGRTRTLVRLAAVCLLGVWRQSTVGGAASADGGGEARLLTLQGLVVRPPIEAVEHRGGSEEVLSSLELHTLSEKAPVRLRCRGTLGHVRGGDLVRASGRLLPPLGIRNPGDRGGSRSSLLLVSRAEHVRVLESPGPLCPPTALGRLRDRLQRVILETHTAHIRGLILSVLLGDRRLLADDIHDTLLRTGTYHLLAISGLHVGLVLFLITRLPVHRRARIPFQVGVLLGFTVLTGASPPVLRAALMFLLAAGTVLSGRPVVPLNTLGAAAAILLGASPSLLHSVGFQLSFVAVLSILTWGRRLGSRVAAGRPLSPPILSLAISLATCVGTAPLVLLYFHRLHPLAPLWNLLAAPVAFVAVVGGLGSLLLGLIHPTLGVPLALVTDLCLEALLGILRLAACVPGSQLLFPPPARLFVAAALALLFMGLSCRGRAWAVAAAPCILLAAALAGLLVPRPVEFCHLDVGEGSAAVLSLPGAGTFLFDAGFRGRDSRAGAGLTHAILSTGSRALEGVFVTHFHHDHVKALQGVTDRLRVSRLWTSSFGLERAEPFSRLRDGSPPVSALARGAIVRFPEVPGFRLEVLHPSLADGLLTAEMENDTSLALRLLGGRSAVLLLGDIEEHGTARLLATGADLRSDVLVAPHHGRPNRLWPLLLERVRPRSVVISGAGLPPSRKVAAWLESRGLRVFATWRRGAVEITWSRLEGWRARYRGG